MGVTAPSSSSGLSTETLPREETVPATPSTESKEPITAPSRAVTSEVSVPSRSLSESFFRSKETDRLIAEHEINMNALSGRAGGHEGMSRAELETLGALSGLVSYAYGETKFPEVGIRKPISIYSHLKQIPPHFIHAKFTIPEHLTMPYRGGGTIKNLRIIVSNLLLSTDSRFLAMSCPFSLRESFPGFSRYSSSIAIQVTLRENNKKELLMVNGRMMIELVYSIFSRRDVFYERSHMNTGPACSAPEWIDLPYDPETEVFYRERLHPRLIAEALEQTSACPGVIVLELGAGTGALSVDLFKRLSQAGKEAHVLATELLPENVELAQKASNDLPRSETGTLEFYPCNSMALMNTLGPRLMEKIETIQKQSHERHGQKSPLVVVSSGGMNRLVLNNLFESGRVMQNLFRLTPDLMIASGITETLLTKQIIKKTGFTGIRSWESQENGMQGTCFYMMKAKTVPELIRYHEAKLVADPSLLDLILSPDPLNILRGLRPELLAGLKILDVSHAFFLDEAEACQFLGLAMARCPRLDLLLHHFGLSGDGIQMEKAMASLEAKEADSRAFLKKVHREPVPRDQDLAVPKDFLLRLVTPQ